MRRSSSIALAVVVGLVVATGVWLLLNRGTAAETATGPVAMDEPLPALAGAALDGGNVSTDVLDGKVGVINVWATWCGPCRREQPVLTSLAEHYGDRVAFLGINYRDEKAGARRWVHDEFSVSYPSLFDPSGKTASSLGYPALPDTYVVDASGRIRWWIFGGATEQELSALIDGLLAEDASPSSSV